VLSRDSLIELDLTIIEAPSYFGLQGGVQGDVTFALIFVNLLCLGTASPNRSAKTLVSVITPLLLGQCHLDCESASLHGCDLPATWISTPYCAAFSKPISSSAGRSS
jgi:hypothetical protein